MNYIYRAMENFRFKYLSVLVFIAIGAFFFGFIKPASATTFYVSPSGSNTSPYDTWAKAANLPSTVITAGNSLAGPHTAYIAPGTYVGSIAITGVNWAGGTIFGTSAHGSTSPATFGQVNISPTTGVALTSGRADQTIEYISATSPDNAVLSIGSTNFYGKGLYLHDGTNLVFLPYLATSATIEYSKILGNSDNLGVVSSSSNNLTFNYCLFGNSETNLFGKGTASSRNGIVQLGSGILTVNNSSLLEARASNLVNEGAGSVVANNNIIVPGSDFNNYYGISRISGTMSVNNSALIGNMQYPSSIRGGTITEQNNLDNPKINFVHYPRQAFVVPSVDDTSGAPYAKDLSDELLSRGQGGTFYVNNTGLSTYQSTIQEIINDGAVEIQGHSRSHDKMTYSGPLYTITKAGETINIDRSGDTISISNTGTVSGFKSKTLQVISAELVAMGATVSALASSDITVNSLGEIIADSSGAQASPYISQVLIDPTGDTGFYYSEIVSAASELATALGVPIDIFAPPYGSTNDNVKNICQAKGFRACRAGSDWELKSLDLQSLRYFLVSNIVGVDDAETAAKTRSFAHTALKVGGLISLLGHSTSEATIQQWSVVLDTLKNEFPQIQVTKMSTAIDEIRDGATWATSDNRTYTRSWNDSSANYNLSYNSELIDVGIDVGLTGDLAGNPIYGTPDIGAYEYQPPHDITLATPDTIDIGAGARIYANGKFRDLGTTNATPASLKITPASGSFTVYGAIDTKPAWLDVTNILNWTNTHKTWTEGNAVAGLTNTLHVVGDLNADKYYNVKLDDVLGQNITGNDCTGGFCQAVFSGEITFSYSCSYSFLFFDVTEEAIAPTNVGISSVVVDSTSKLTITAQTAVDSGSGLHTTPYWFSETSGNAGSSSSSDWQASTTFIDDDLSCSTQYTYKVKVRDANGNESAFSDPVSVSTDGCSSSGSRTTRRVTIPSTPVAPTITPNPLLSSEPSVYNFGPVVLKQKSRGEAVKELQRFLNANLNLGLIVDGIFGPKTLAVIKQWQKDNGLVVDGLVGPKTKVKMNLVNKN